MRLNVGRMKVDIGIYFIFNLNRYTLNNAEALNVNLIRKILISELFILLTELINILTLP